MALQEKYRELLDAARTGGINNLSVTEQGSVLYVKGDTPSGELKDSLWNIYNKIDPDFRSGDLVLDIDTSAASGSKAKVVTKSSNLNIRKGPGTDQEIIGKAAHHEIVNVISRANDQWSLVRTDDGEEGYVYSIYLEQV